MMKTTWKKSFLFVVFLALFGIHCSGDKPKSLRVGKNKIGEVKGRLKVVLHFSSKMVKEDQVDKQVDPPVFFSPKIEGEAKWLDSKTLAFNSDRYLPASMTYKGEVPKDLRALDGARLEEPFTFEFYTKRIEGDVVIVGSAERALSTQLVTLDFNQKVPFEEIKKNCSYNSNTGKFGAKLEQDSDAGPSKSFRVIPEGELSLNTDWIFICKNNLRGTEGNTGTKEVITAKFKTYGPFEFIKTDPSGNDIVPEEGLQLALAFSNPLKKPYKVKIEPAVPGFPERCHSLGSDPAGLDCKVMLEAQTNYAITIPKGQKDIFDQRLGEKKVVHFRTSDAKPTVSMEDGYFIAELKRPVLPIWTRNVTELDIKALKVTPENFHQLRPLLYWWDNEPADFEKSKLSPKEKTIQISSTQNKWGQHPIDPSKILPVEPGSGMYYMEVASKEVEKNHKYDSGRRKVLVNFTDIGIVTKLSSARGLVWATSLSTGRPLPGAKVNVRNSKGRVTWSGITDHQGVAMLPGRSELRVKTKSAGQQDQGSEDDESIQEDYYEALDVFVSTGTDWSMVNAVRTGGLTTSNFNVSKEYNRTPVKLRGFMHTDRGLYRPGDKIHVKGLARETSLGSTLKVPREKEVKIEVEDPRGKVLYQTEARLSRFGGFWFDIDLPGDARLGDYTLRAKLKNGVFGSRFSVEEYRPATFEVVGSSKNKRVVRRGEVEAKISANYFYGAPLRTGDAKMAVYSRPREVTFPEYKGFDFRDWRHYSYYHSSQHSQQLITEDSISLDENGNASLAFGVTPSDIHTDADLLVRASVTSPSNEVINKTFVVPYFRSRRYFGIKAPGYFFEVNEKQKFQVVGVKPNGQMADDPAKVTVTRRDWNCVWEDWGYRGSYKCKEETHEVLRKTLEFTDGNPAEFEFVSDRGGEYLVVVEGNKDYHAPAAQEFYAWGDGEGYWRSEDSMTFDIITDKKEYRAGDTAILVLKTDLSQATGLVTIERDGVIEKRLVEINKDVKHIEIPIDDSYAPNIYASVALVQGRLGEGRRGKPRMRMGLVNLQVRPDGNTLQVSVKTDRKDYRPGDPVKATVEVLDANNKPVSAEVALTAADEGVLSLVNFKTPNPIPTFYLPWGIGVDTATQYAYLKNIPGPNLERPATGGDSGGPGSVRSRFLATAVWKPGIVTNSQGIGQVTFDAPDNLTAFRVMAVAADTGYRFGSTDKRFTISKPLQLHRALPRFLSIGDKLKGGVVVHNETGAPGNATVKLVTDERLNIEGPSEKTVAVPKGGRILVPFNIEATEIGETALTFSVQMGEHRDAVEFKLPVNHPSPIQVQQLASGQTIDTKEMPITLPENALPSTATLHVSVDPHGLAGIENGLRDLIGYPYGCLEQTTSKVIPMLAVRSLAETLNIEGLAGDKLEGFIKAGIAKIGRHQTSDGGFSLWPGGTAETYYTGYALWGLFVAKQAGYKVDPTRIEDGLAYLRYQASKEDTSKPYYNRTGNLGSQAFALYIRAMLGDKDTQAATKLNEKSDQLPVYGKAFLAMAMAAGLGNEDPVVKALVQELSSIAKEAIQAQTLIDEPDKKSLYWYMSNAVRTTAIVLDALVALDKENENIPPLVQSLMKERRSIRYMSTQANIYSLLALMSYAKSVTGTAPSVEVIIDGDTVISGTLKGDEQIKVASKAFSSSNSLVVIKPEGELFYNIQLRYREKIETVKAQSNGLSIKREYLDKNGDPVSRFKVGDVVRVRLTMPLESSVNHLMISDHLPAGFEALNTRLATVGVAGVEETEMDEYWGAFREIHDERVDFSTEYNWRTTYTREYMVRAIAEGRFVLPPCVAELMYEPEVNTRTDLEQIEIGPK